MNKTKKNIPFLEKGKVNKTAKTNTVAKQKSKKMYACIGAFYTFFMTFDFKQCLRWYGVLSDKPISGNKFFDKFKKGNEQELYQYDCFPVKETDYAAYGFRSISGDYSFGVVDHEMSDNEAFNEISEDNPDCMEMCCKVKIDSDKVQ